MMVSNLIQRINRCLIPKLSKNYNESNKHLEFDARNKNLATNFKILVESLHDLKKTDLQENPSAVALLLNLFYELRCDGQWNDSSSKNVSELLDTQFQEITSIHLDSIFFKNDVFDSQEIFDKFFEEMHFKLTYEDFKKYPAQIEVYYLLSQKVKDYYVAVEPSKIFPLSLVLVEDYESFNKKKGLQCCTSLLQALESSAFQNGNYYEVIYRTIKINLSEKDDDIINLTHSNLLMLLDILPDSGKGKILDELYKTCLDLLLIESNLYKKATMFNLMYTVIQHHKYNCANKSIFKDIVYQNLDMCINNTIVEILLEPLLKCLEIWIIHCWPMWKCGSDHNILSALLKVLYVCDNENLVKKIHNIMVTLICLATKDEQSKIISNLERVQEIHCDVFQKKIRDIILDLC